MSKYKIKYNYDTGDSFHNEYDVEGNLELEWQNLEIAKANLKRIEEHYKQYREIESYRGKDDQTILEGNKDKDWFVKKDRLVTFKPNHTESYWAIDEKDKEKCLKAGNTIAIFIEVMTAQHQIILYTDDNKPWQIFAPWCGYFETLNYAEIVEDNSDRKIEFK